jgi:hypothetical protein
MQMVKNFTGFLFRSVTEQISFEGLIGTSFSSL